MRIKTIPRAEDDPGAAELSLAALEGNSLANPVLVGHVGEEALDRLCRREKFKTRAPGNPVVRLLDLKRPKISED